MKILISNDDGYLAPGLLALVDAFAQEHELIVVAPDREQSATSHKITLDRPLRAHLATEKPNLLVYAVDGTPADCVKLAFDTLLDSPPDVVISGINRGPNLGIDTRYSGTVAAAFEGVQMGVPSFAVSLAGTEGPLRFDQAARFAREVIHRLLHSDFNFSGTLVNINVPNIASVAGLKVTRLHRDIYRECYVEQADPRGRSCHWLVGKLEETDQDPGSDRQAVQSGFISITPLKLDQTDYGRRAELESSIDSVYKV